MTSLRLSMPSAAVGERGGSRQREVVLTLTRLYVCEVWECVMCGDM